MIDLHLHTTASDGRSSPSDLVHAAAGAGITTLAVTDHDTVASVPAVREAATRAGLGFVPGIELTAVHQGRDIHILGYFVDEAHAPLEAFLVGQRRDRRRRVLEMVDRLAALGLPIELDPAALAADQGRSLGRPLVAAALVAGGHAATVNEAFARWLSPGMPAFVDRQGATPAQVIAHVRDAGGLASLAHPGKAHVDDGIPEWVEAGLEAIEVFHPDHAPDAVAHYGALARMLGLSVTGGSDYHGPGSGRSEALGRVGLPAAAYEALTARARGRSSA